MDFYIPFLVATAVPLLVLFCPLSIFQLPLSTPLGESCSKECLDEKLAAEIGVW